MQSLAAFPQVLAMMSDRLEWTQQLGDAVLANRQQVMDTVQALRARAEAAGTLQDTDQQHVYTSDQAIIIEPAQFDYVYVPVYDPMLAYGPWWVASYQPFFWYPPAFFGYPVRWHGSGIVWGRPCRVDRNHWGWAHPEWRAGTIGVTIGRNEFFNRPQYRDYRGTVSWQHAPEHRRGVAYGSALVRDRFVNAERRATDARRELRTGAPSAAPGRQARHDHAAPQTAPGYRQAPSDPRATPQMAPAYRQAPPDSRAAPQSAPAYRQAPPRPAPRRHAMPQVQAQPRVAPPPSMPRADCRDAASGTRAAAIDAPCDRHHAAGRGRAAAGVCAGSRPGGSRRPSGSSARAGRPRGYRTVAALIASCGGRRARGNFRACRAALQY